eukprot:1005480-Amphidinium_carterae.1
MQLPKRSPEAIFQSLKYQLGRCPEADPDRTYEDAVLRRMSRRLLRLTRDTTYHGIASFRTLVSYVLSCFDSSKSTQFSNVPEIGPTYGKMKENVDSVQEILLERYCMLAFYTAMSAQSNVRSSIRLGLVDPRRLFVKNELHTQEKADQGRWRIIWAVSAVDQVFEGLFTKEHNQAIAGSYFKQTWTKSG